jgi:hypothetical protein
MEHHEKPLTVLLLRLHCYFVEEAGYDDVFLKFKGKKIWPKDKKQQAVMMDTTTELNVELHGIERHQPIEVELWDWDLLSPNDKLGVFKMIIDGSPGPFSTDMVQNLIETKKAKYTLDWEVY